MVQDALAYNDSPVKSSHLEMIEALFAENGLKEASVSFDRTGRVELKGSYEDMRGVNLAFSLAQTVVGVKWVSPVTPENIKVKEWEKKLSSLFPTKEQEIVPPFLESTSPGVIDNKYAIVVGVSKFKEQRITPLEYADDDAQAFYDFIVNSEGGNFKRENVFLLMNEKATRENIISAFENVKSKAKENDLVILYFSTHGTPPGPFGGVHMVTYDSVVKPRQAIWETSITDEMLKEFISSLRSKRLIVVMDACYSNGAYKQVPGFLPPGGKSLGADEEEGFGNSKAYMAKRILGAKDIVLEDEDITKSASKGGWGKVLFSASDAGEKSWESDTLKHSFFTYYFMDGLKKYGDIKQAFEYAKPKVTSGVRKEKDAEQHPQVVADRKEWDIAIK